MPQVRASLQLPYLLLLPNDTYPTPAIGGTILLKELAVGQIGGEPDVPITSASLSFSAPHSMPEDEVGRTKIEQADALLRRMNHLLRWYRAISR